MRTRSRRSPKSLFGHEPSTKPKPFAFVLMTFDTKFDDIYRFGIKGAAEDAGAYAERVDEQIFTEGMLDRVFNQINKSDIIIADMTGKNPNVFYEVGYVHALDKIVLLITQEADDIPFDLKHRQHIVYGGKIDRLRKDLTPRITWGILESENRKMGSATETITVRVNGVKLQPGFADPPVMEVPAESRRYRSLWGTDLLLQVYNLSERDTLALEPIYLFSEENTAIFPLSEASDRVPTLIAEPADCPDSLTSQFLLGISFGKMSPRTTDSRSILMGARSPDCTSLFRLRLHSEHSYFDFPFRLILNKPS